MTSSDPAPSSALSLEALTGRNIRSVRLARRLTLDALAQLVGITKGQLSKIENGHVSVPLATLARIGQALEIEPAVLLRRTDGAACLTLSHEQQSQRREKIRSRERAHHYERLFPERGFESSFEPMHGRLRTEADFVSYKYPGAVLIQVLQGSVVYRFGQDDYPLHPGDILYCDGRTEHGPVAILAGPVDYLLILANPRA